MVEQQYVITQDTKGLFTKVNPEINLESNDQFTQASELYFQQIGEVLSDIMPENVSVTMFDEEEIESRLQEKIVPVLEEDESSVVICLDRFLLSNIEASDDYNNRFFRFSMCRTTEGEKVPRQNGKSFEDQIQQLVEKIPDITSRKVLVVDDGLFSGGTVKEFVSLATQNGTQLNIDKIIGFIGSSCDGKVDLPPVEIEEQIDNLYEWVDIRDLSPFGGKRYKSSKTNNVTSAVPYIFPWSDGQSASFNLSPSFFETSNELIDSFKQLVQSYQDSTGQEPLTFRQLVRSGFPLPTDLLKQIPVSINDTVEGYLDRCQNLIRREQAREVAVFDMDGTLYQLDGENNGFRESSLKKAIEKNALKFIRENEGCSDDRASELLNEANTDKIGISNYLLERYGISRTDYFNRAWNVDPSGIIKDFQTAKAVIPEFKARNPNTKIILLTAAPRVWAKTVMEYLEIGDYFETIYTGEQYGTKEEIFEMLAGRYKPENILSIGDQLETDIIPAEKRGMKSLLVDNPDSLQLLINV